MMHDIGVCGLARSRWVSHGSRTGGDRRGVKPLRLMRTVQACPLSATLPLSLTPPSASAANSSNSSRNSSNSSNNNNNNNSTRIAITITITLATRRTAGVRLGSELRRRQHGRVLPPRADLELVQRHGRVCRRVRRLLGKDIHASVRPVQTAAVGSCCELTLGRRGLKCVEYTYHCVC